MTRRLAALLLLTAAACKAKDVPPRTAPAPVAIVVDAALAASPIPAASTELLVGIAASWDATTAQLQRYHRASGDAWIADGDAWTAVVGKGSAWGAGLHGDGPPPGATGPLKHEGDGKSPAGVFALLGAYGYDAVEPARDATAAPGLPYRQLTDDVRCIDDGADAAYNSIIATPTTATSFEQMHRPDDLYKYVVEVGHNPRHTPGAGSCIFLHIWRDAASPTVGCTAMPESTIAVLIQWLRREARPVYVLLPRTEYERLSGTWGLPR